MRNFLGFKKDSYGMTFVHEREIENIFKSGDKAWLREF